MSRLCQGIAALLAFLVIGIAQADEKCLACHAQEGMTKSFDNGDTVPLQVKAEEFAASVHAPAGCAACHGDVDLKTHPGSGKKYSSAREFSLAQAGACRQCHEDAAKQHEGSIHAKRIAEGSTVAPACTGCHGFHTVTPKTAYQTCTTCHATALEAHAKWLPNAARHHEVVSCAACHAPKALRMVDLRLYDRAARGWVVEKAGDGWFEKIAKSVDPSGKGLDSDGLRQLLGQLNTEGKRDKTLRGRIELRNNVEAHRISAGSEAIRACDNCHRAGAEPFQNVTVSMTGSDGRPIRHPAQKEVLSSALSIESLPEFYAIGGTRSPLLDILFVLALAGGLAFPVGHLSIRWLARKLRR
jgi:hypothetical protein